MRAVCAWRGHRPEHSVRRTRSRGDRSDAQPGVASAVAGTLTLTVTRTIALDITANPGDVRHAFLTIAGQRVNVTQQRR